VEDAKILVVDDDPDILTAADFALKRYFSKISTLENPAGLIERLGKLRPEVVLLDMNFGPGKSSGEEGLAWLDRIAADSPDTVVVVITAHGGVDLAVQAMRRGANDFVTKPWQNEKLVATISAALALARSRRETQRLRSQTQALAQATDGVRHTMIGTSPAMGEIHSLIARAGPTDANVLVLGENGTGKELVARAIHQASARRGAPFLCADVGALPETLFESTLFGHRRGAFTDARENRMGLFEAARGGTLLLDEIGNIPLHLQAKLLHVLETREVTPLGASRPVSVDVRVVAATNAPSETLHDAQRFRPDLLYRLNTIEIVLPPLRERSEDIPALVQHYLDLYQRKYAKPARPLAPGVMETLVAAPWPGNIRALRHAIERAVILSEGECYKTTDFAAAALTVEPTSEARGAHDLPLAEIERRAVETALKGHSYNISQAAKALGITRAALYRRMEKHGL